MGQLYSATRRWLFPRSEYTQLYEKEREADFHRELDAELAKIDADEKKNYALIQVAEEQVSVLDEARKKIVGAHVLERRPPSTEERLRAKNLTLTLQLRRKEADYAWNNINNLIDMRLYIHKARSRIDVSKDGDGLLHLRSRLNKFKSKHRRAVDSERDDQAEIEQDKEKHAMAEELEATSAADSMGGGVGAKKLAKVLKSSNLDADIDALFDNAQRQAFDTASLDVAAASSLWPGITSTSAPAPAPAPAPAQQATQL